MSVAIFTPTPYINKWQMSLCMTMHIESHPLNMVTMCLEDTTGTPLEVHQRKRVFSVEYEMIVIASIQCGARCSSVVRAFAHGAMGRQIDPPWGGPFELFLVPASYPVCGVVHIKEPLLLIEKSSPCGGSGFPLSLSEWSFTICLTPYNRK